MGVTLSCGCSAFSSWVHTRAVEGPRSIPALLLASRAEGITVNLWFLLPTRTSLYDQGSGIRAERRPIAFGRARCASPGMCTRRRARLPRWYCPLLERRSAADHSKGRGIALYSSTVTGELGLGRATDPLESLHRKEGRGDHHAPEPPGVVNVMEGGRPPPGVSHTMYDHLAGRGPLYRLGRLFRIPRARCSHGSTGRGGATGQRAA